MDQRAEEIRRNIGKQPLDIKVEDFIDLGEAYFWFLDWIDPFSGKDGQSNLLNPYLPILGSIFEKPVTDGEVGPTNGKIIGEQFKGLKYGDRFFFSHKYDGKAGVLEEVAKANIFR